MMVYTYADIVNQLSEVGLCVGDSVFIHSNLGFFGKLDGCSDARTLCQSFYLALCEVLGKEGTIIVPAFTYSFCHGEIFNLQDTKTACGMFPEYIRGLEEARRSMDPNFSVVSIGPKSDIYTSDCPNESFGKGSFWEKFLKNRGKILCLNFDSGSTFVHYVEHENNVSYRYNKAFNGIMVDKGVEKRDYFVHYVYDLEKPEDAPDFTRLDKLCKEYGICKHTRLGQGSINCMKSDEYFDFISKWLRKEPRFLTKGGANCE